MQKRETRGEAKTDRHSVLERLCRSDNVPKMVSFSRPCALADSDRAFAGLQVERVR